VAIGLPDGQVLEEFEIAHRPEGFQEFFSRIEKHQKAQGCGVAVAMEGYNGYARPLDTLVRQRGYRLYNINNLSSHDSRRSFLGRPRRIGLMRARDWSCFSSAITSRWPRESCRKLRGRPRRMKFLSGLPGAGAD